MAMNVIAVPPRTVGRRRSRMKRKILIAASVLGVVLIAAGVFIALQPDTFSVQRSASLAAPRTAVFARVNDLRAWDSWSPFKDLDPGAKMTFSDPAEGKGAICAWSGNDQVGEGTLTILESRPDAAVVLEQRFVRPLPGTARMSFAFEPEGGGTRVTWKMDGSNNFIGKAVCLVMNMDSLLGPQFDKGLANLKRVVENGGAEPAGMSR